MIEALAAIGGVGTAGALVAVVVLALKLSAAKDATRSETKRAGDNDKRAALLDANNTMLATKLGETTEQLDDAKERLDGLEEMLIDAAAGQPVAGSFARLLARLKAARAAEGDHGDGDGDGAVLHDGAADREDPDRLLAPGE